MAYNQCFSELLYPCVLYFSVSLTKSVPGILRTRKVISVLPRIRFRCARLDEKRPGFPPTISSASGRPIGRKMHAKEEKKNQVRKRPCLEKIFNLNQQ